MIKCSLGLQLSVWIMQVSTFSSVHINRFHCIPVGLIHIYTIWCNISTYFDLFDNIDPIKAVCYGVSQSCYCSLPWLTVIHCYLRISLRSSCNLIEKNEAFECSVSTIIFPTSTP